MVSDKKTKRRVLPSRSRLGASARAVGVAGLATSTMAGALVVVAPQAMANASTPVALTSTSNPLQPVIDAVLAEMQKAVDYDTAWQYSSPDSIAQLPAIIQNTEFQLLQLMLAMTMGASQGILYQTPEVMAGAAADPRQ